ncbi:MAG TPA: bifunctional aspartate kinase/homoserine dehydrogenase I, partial [Rectinemataceae bacterium]|nr:bifunctional aspartate kinase/homoserine dehydrogenase I [Rectinemataceae bacterium]
YAEKRQDYSGILDSLRDRHCQVAQALLPAGETAAVLSFTHTLFAELSELLQGVSLLKDLDLSKQTLDQIMSFGERLSAEIIAKALSAEGIPSFPIDARELIKTDASFGSAHWLEGETRKRVVGKLADIDFTAVVTGFIGSTMGGATTTLGRGGSDITASILGACLGAEEIQLWTDLDGMFSAEPQLVPDTIVIEEISYEEALEMMHFGAKGLHPTSLQPAMRAGVPLRILNSFNPDGKGTLIVKHAGESRYPVRGLASIPSVSLLTIHGLGMPGVTGIAGRMFSALAKAKVNVILITQASSELSICCAISPDEALAGARALRKEFAMEIEAGLIGEPAIESELSVVAVVGEQMKQRTGIAGRVFTALGRNGVNVVAIAQGSSELNISIVTSSKNRAKALNVIHDAFFLAGIRTVNLFLAGAGLIGGTLLAQIAKQKERLLREHSIRINLLGILNSRTMLIDAEGIDVHGWKDRLASGRKADIGVFVETMKRMNLPSTCFCDCTASETPPEFYQEILAASIAVVTPNKRANAGPFDRYKALKETVRQKDVFYGYETTVGAGLPVLGTLHDLVACGDAITKIEAVLSGTISFIFNGLGKGKSFSALVSDAKQRGYTEPDPRDDLGAVDVARKTLILIREAGFAMDLGDIAIQPLLPEKVAKAP